MARHPFAILADDLTNSGHRTSFRVATFDSPESIIDDGYVSSVYVRDPRNGESPEFIVIPHAGGPDAFGTDFISESNYRSLIRDFGEDTFVRLSYMNRDDLMLAIPQYWEDNGETGRDDEWETAVALSEAVRHLFDYAIYDEDDWSQLEFEAAEASWDAWLSWDVRHAVTRIIHESHGDTVGDIAAEWIGNHDADLRERFDTLRADDNLSYETSGWGDIIFPDWETHTVPLLAAHVLSAITD